MKTLCISVEKQFTHMFWMYNNNGEALINFEHQCPTVQNKQDAKYKDSSFKDAKWKEIAGILCLPKEDVIQKWKSLRDTFLRQNKKIKCQIQKWGWLK